MKFVINSTENGTEEEVKYLHSVVDVLNKLVKTSIFKSRFFDFDFTSLQRREMNSAGQQYDEVLTNEQIWNIFFEGAELANREVDYEIDLKVKFFYREHGNVLAMANSSTGEIKLNSKYWLSRGFANSAATVIHESAHLFGFYHISPGERSSIPYGIGLITKEMLRDNMKQIVAGKDKVRVFKCLKYPKWWR